MDAIFGFIGKKKRQKIKAEREKTLERELVRGQIERVETHPTTTLSVRGRNDDDMVQRTRLKSGQKPCFGDIVKINTDQKGTVLGTVIGIMRKQDWDHGTTYYLRLGRTAQKKGWFGTSWHDDNVDAEEIVRASHATLVKRQHIALEEALVAKFEDKNSTADQKISALERLVEVLGDAENPQKKSARKSKLTHYKTVLGAILLETAELKRRGEGLRLLHSINDGKLWFNRDLSIQKRVRRNVTTNLKKLSAFPSAALAEAATPANAATPPSVQPAQNEPQVA